MYPIHLPVSTANRPHPRWSGHLQQQAEIQSIQILLQGPEARSSEAVRSRAPASQASSLEVVAFCHWASNSEALKSMARFQFRGCTKLTSSWDYSWVDCGLLGCGAVGGVPRAWRGNNSQEDANDSTEGQIQSLTTQRDALVGQMIGLINGAEFNGQSFGDAKAQSLIAQGQAVPSQANGLPH